MAHVPEEQRERQRVERGHEPVAAHGGVFREEEQETNHKPHQPLRRQQQAVPPQGGLARAAFPSDEAEGEEQHQRHCHARRGGRTGGGGSLGGRENAAGGESERLHRAVGQAAAGGGQEVFGIDGRERLMPARGRRVNFAAQHQVLAETVPGRGGRKLVNDVAQRLGASLAVGCRFRPFYLSAGGDVDQVDGTRGAVVVEKVVAIRSVFGQRLCEQRLEYAFLLAGREAQHLFVHAAPVAPVHGEEMLHRFHAELVVGLAGNEPRHEIGLLETEHAVIEHPVLAVA